VHPLIHTIARALFRAGGLGVLTLGVLDSSPIVLPFGNDLLVLALCARYHTRAPYYVFMATAGSLIGCFVTYWIGRRSESSQKKVMSVKRLAKIREFVQKRAPFALILASLLPPPFPFTMIVGTVAAFRYPPRKLFGFIAVGRFTRFTIEAALAIHYGRWIVRQARSTLLEHIMIALIIISLLGTAASIYKWLAQGRRKPIVRHATS
jgi:membrane protein YqaA with SNARE-associated domain